MFCVLPFLPSLFRRLYLSAISLPSERMIGMPLKRGQFATRRTGKSLISPFSITICVVFIGGFPQLEAVQFLLPLLKINFARWRESFHKGGLT